MVANSAFEAPFDPPMLGFRSDPYDNQSGEMEADGVGLYGDDTVDTRKEVGELRTFGGSKNLNWSPVRNGGIPHSNASDQAICLE